MEPAAILIDCSLANAEQFTVTLGKRTHRQSFLPKGYEHKHRREAKRARKCQKMPKLPSGNALDDFLSGIEEDLGPHELRREEFMPSRLPQLSRTRAVIMMSVQNQALYI
mmetsp:Transcript_30562/g.37679  ORF Transcript_30562/g.37679 Transcript_30562/m.37679 type:complete len:110 (+) Transcript_30562:951-1280(+)